MIAYCGFSCLECPAYIATQADDDKLRADCAQKWAEEFQYNLRPDQVNCDGCKAEGRKFFVCKMCSVRKCAMERSLDNCARCEDLNCEKLAQLMSMFPNVRESMQALRQEAGK